MKSVLDLKLNKSEILAVDNFLLILHPFQRYTRFIYLDFRRFKNRFEFRNFTCLYIATIVFFIDIVGHIIKLTILIHQSNWYATQKQLAIMSLEFCALARGLLLLIKSKDIAKFANELDECHPKTLHLQQLMKVHNVAKDIKNHYNILYPYVTTSTTAYFCIPLIRFFFMYEKGNPVTDEFHQQNSWLPFNLRESNAAYPYVYLLETFEVLCACTFYITWDISAQIFTRLMCMHFEFLNELVLQMDVSQASNVEESVEFFKYLHEVLAYQRRINALGSELNRIFGLNILISSILWSLAICFLINMIVNEKDILDKIVFAAMLVILIFLLFDVSKLGTLLESSTSRLKENLYFQNWTASHSAAYAKIHIIMMQRANFPLTFTGFKTFSISMEHFKSIILLAYNLFTFLQSRRST